MQARQPRSSPSDSRGSLGGSLGDRLGRRRIFILGVIWFTVASVGCAFAPSTAVLIGMRALQGAGAALLTRAAPAAADPSPVDKATAQALFDDGKRLLKEKSYAEACPKLAESMRLDPALGTKLHLADCYEKNGQTASAWVLFREAAEQAKIANQLDRFKKASDRADALALRLCRLRIEVSVEAEVTGVEVVRDGRFVAVIAEREEQAEQALRELPRS